ncbi:vacuolar sorting protein 9 VPS9 domain containing protein [Nitzschia inconspicua]|uniref:Vacuolar sorting protein 9 VPS9 domain containing protein n=1 Tax=Nitzschia inconspicua TaxID=303405 RepID=A0A9K3LP50_9STRA|nr:vacuolar sorting protein 9 VPS9 domain containing protein [Nitzschia inconspicua]
MSAPNQTGANTELADAGGPPNPLSQSSSSSLLVPKVSVVTPQRKEELLLKARAERRHWIEQVPLPYSLECYQPSRSSSAFARTLSGAPGNDLWTMPSTTTTSGDGKGSNNLYKIQTSVVCQKYLPSATATISELYGLPTKPLKLVEEPATSPLNLEQVAQRVESLVAPYLDAQNDGSSPPPDTLPSNEDAQVSTTQISIDKKSTLDITSDPLVLQAYQDLWTSLLWPESSVLVQGMKNFLFNWTQNHFNTDDTPSLSSASTALKTYCKSTVDSLVKSNKNLVTTIEDSSRLRRSMESFVYGQVREVIRKAINESLETPNQESAKEDGDEHAPAMTPSQFEEKLLDLQFVKPSHLEIACLQDDTDKPEESELHRLLKEPIRALLSVEAYHSPFEKLQQILSVYQGVNAALLEALNKGNTGPSILPSADDVLPTIILTCIKAQPQNLLQNLQFIEQFAAPEYLRGEAGYAYTNLYGAVQFLQDLDLKGSEQAGSSSNQLSINPEDLKQGLEKCRKLRDDLVASNSVATTSRVMSNPFVDGRGLPKSLPEVKISVQEVHSAQARGETVDLQWAAERQQVQPQEAPTVSSNSRSSLPDGFRRSYTFLNAQPSDIRVTDLSQLLEEYRMLVQVTEELLSERADRLKAERKQRELEQQQAMGEKLLLGDP